MGEVHIPKDPPQHTPGSTGPGNPKEGARPGEVPKK